VASSRTKRNHEPKHSHVVPRVEHLHGEPIAVRDVVRSAPRLMSIASVSDGRTRELVASDYRWVHGSAAELAAKAPFRCRATSDFAGFGAKIMAEARCDGTPAHLKFATNLNRLGDCHGGPAGLHARARASRQRFAR